MINENFLSFEKFELYVYLGEISLILLYHAWSSHYFIQA